MTYIARNPTLLFFALFTVVLLVSQLPAKHRNTDLAKRLSPLLYVFGVFWVIVLVAFYTSYHAQMTLVPVLFFVLAVVGVLVKRQMWKTWAVRKYSHTKVVFEDPYAGTDSATPPPPQPPAGWFPDTSSQHQLRYWDGSRWTEHVSDNGVSAVDPVP